MNERIKSIILFIIGGIIYYFMEIFYRGYSNWTMMIVGGLCFIFIGKINEYFSWKTSLILQCIIGALIVTILELTSGIVINKIFNMNVWDYSDLKYNLLGQISLISSLCWIPMSLLAIIVDDFIRWKLFKEDKPKYKL